MQLHMFLQSLLGCKRAAANGTLVRPLLQVHDFDMSLQVEPRLVGLVASCAAVKPSRNHSGINIDPAFL